MRYFLGSADMMSRKLDRRVEVVTPVAEPAVQARLQEPTTTDVDIHRRPQALARGRTRAGEREEPPQLGRT